MNKKGFVLSTYVYILLVFFLLLLVTMLAVLNNTKLLSNKLKEQTQNSSGLLDKDFSFVLLGDKDIVIKKGDEYVDATYIAKTSKGKDISNNVKVVGNVDVNNPNTYTLTYKLTYNGVTKELKRNIHVLDDIASNYVEGLYDYRRDENSLINSITTYNNVVYDTGIRYIGTNPNNYVYYNCEDIDSNGASYGETNYDYVSSCEVWRIIGVFDVSNGTTTEKRVKLINSASTFSASWDSSASGVNNGYGINQWGASGSYEGADLMKLLNGYYIGAENSTCTYCNDSHQAICQQTCTSEGLKSEKMKVLTSVAKRMTEIALWDTYGVDSGLFPLTGSNASSAYLQEKGISTQYTGKICTSGDYCNDGVIRTPSWTGLVGLATASDMGYANEWLYSSSLTSWAISPAIHSDDARDVWNVSINFVSWCNAYPQRRVWPSLYLKSSVKIASGNGTQNNPYKLSL